MKPGKLVLSRKGFDTTRRSQHSSGLAFPYGGVPSPIFPDGSLYSLPIPGCDDVAPITYGDLYHGDESGPISIGRVVEDLTLGRATMWASDHYAFVSPNIRHPILWEIEGRRGMVHQGTPSQWGHLRNQGITAGDLFLFFGLFRRIEQKKEDGALSGVPCPSTSCSGGYRWDWSITMTPRTTVHGLWPVTSWIWAPTWKPRDSASSQWFKNGSC